MEVTAEVTGEVRLLKKLSGAMTRKDVCDAFGLRNAEQFCKVHLLPTLEAGLIEMTIPDKPRSRNQRHRLAPARRELLRQRLE